MRSVIRSDDIDGAVFQSLFYRFNILQRAQRGVHLRISVVRTDFIINKRKMMRRHFTGHFDPFMFAFTNQFDRPLCAHMTDMISGIGVFGKSQIPCDHDLFGDAWNSGQSQFR